MNNVTKAVASTEVMAGTLDSQFAALRTSELQSAWNAATPRNSVCSKLRSTYEPFGVVKAAMTPVVTAIDPMVSDCPAAR